MRVAIDGLALGSGRGGDETFLEGVLRGIANEAGPDDRFTVHRALDSSLPMELAGDGRFTTRTVARRPGPLHFAATLPSALRRAGPAPDALFTITHAPVWSPAPVVLTVGDLSFRHHPEFYPRATRVRLEALVPRQARRAQVVVAPSEFSRRDIIETLGLAPEKVRVVPNVVEPPEPLSVADRDSVRRELANLGVRERYVLYLGNLHPRKNVARLVQAFGRARLDDTQLVIAGARWWGAGEEEQAAAQAPPGTIVMLGRVDSKTRQYLLESALALAYPSIFEGFGLPPIEAMAVGTPALVGNRASMPDIAGDAAVAVDPLDVDAIADGIVRITTDDEFRAILRERGFARVKRYSRSVAGQAALEAFEAAIGRDSAKNGEVR
jgi:glycosyltransferase involved in cell wall biosynthesis